MRILMLVFNQPLHGTYWRAYQLAKHLCQRNHQVTLVVTAPAERWRFRLTTEEGGRLRIVEAPDWLPGRLRTGWDLWSALARTLWLGMGRWDIVHAFECRPSVVIPALAQHWGRRTPLVLDWCDWFGRGGAVEERANPLIRLALRPIETFFEERFRGYADATTVINPFLGQRARNLGVPAATITLIRNGSHVSPSLQISQTAARQQLALPPDSPLIGYVGAIFPQDARLLAAAFDRLLAVLPAARLLIIGYCQIAIEDLVRQPSAVIRTGKLPTAEVERYLRACSVGWLPLCDSGANRGRWPLKLNTYMELGLPIVTTAVGDLTEFFAHYPVGVVAAPEAGSFALATIRLLGQPEQAQALGAAGQRLAASELSWSHVATQLEDVYARLVPRQASPTSHVDQGVEHAH